MKNKNCLVFIPNGLNSPELEILVATAQNQINKKKNVNILVCKGGKNYICNKNLLSIPSLCSLCIYKRDKMIKNLKGNFKLIETPEIKNPTKLKNFKNFLKLKKYKFKGLDNGLASYSSYLDNTRDKDLHGFFAKKTISKLVYTTDYLSIFYESFFKNNKIHEIFCFNSRQNLYRPLFRLAIKLKIKLNNLESSHDGKRLNIHNLKSSLVNDYDNLPKLINHRWNVKTKLDKKKISDKYYSDVKNFVNIMENPSVYTSLQYKGLLPKEWNDKVFNISFFASSEDEYESIVKEKDNSLFKSQLESILELCKIIKNKKNFALFVRMHPNLKKVGWSYVEDINNLEGKYKNVYIIKSNSNISTNAMIQNTDLAIGLRSRTLLESTYINKPTIIVGTNYWETLGPFLISNNKHKLKKMILSQKVKCLGSLAAMKYAFFWSTDGVPMQGITGKYKWNKDKSHAQPNFKFKNKSVNFPTLKLYLYYLCKIYERSVFYLNFKLAKKNN